MTFWVEWLRYRDLFWGLVRREVRMRYQGSALGVCWTLLNPLLQMAVYSVVFASILRIDEPNYGTFVFCALLPWTWLSNSLATASDAIVSQAGLVKKVYFPTELLPLVSVTSNLINLLVALPVLGGFLLWSHCLPTAAWLALPLVLAVQFVVTAPLALLVGMLNTFFRDVSHLLGLIMLAWFYLTPVLYPARLIPEAYLPLYWFNPMFHMIDAYRTILLTGQWPSWSGLGLALAMGLALFAVVKPIFSLRKYQFAEVL